MITLDPLSSSDAAAWQELIVRSPAGNLFHNLDFLSYHPPGRHVFHHLVVRDGLEIAAILPGGLVEGVNGTVFSSPLGASVGGFVPRPDCTLDQALQLVDALLEYGRSSGWAGIEIVLPPPIYNGAIASVTSFALSRSGFTLANRSACFLLRLEPRRSGGYTDYFRPRVARYYRAAQRRGAHALRSSGDRMLSRFKPLFEETYARHGSSPTHSFDELTWLAQRFPERFTLHLTEQDGVPIGGTCLMNLNPRVTAAMYTCTSDAHAKDHGVLVAIADAIEMASEQGVSWYDLGPSADHLTKNAGVVSFKEGLGAEVHLRERWALTL